MTRTYLSESGQTRLIKALADGIIPRLKNPKTGKLMSEDLSATMVRRAMQSPYREGHDEILASALRMLDGLNHTPILGKDPLTRQPIYKLTGLSSSVCRDCTAIVWWGTTPHGRKIPLNRRGVSHFTDCPGKRNKRNHKKTAHSGVGSQES